MCKFKVASTVLRPRAIIYVHLKENTGIFQGKWLDLQKKHVFN